MNDVKATDLSQMRSNSLLNAHLAMISGEKAQFEDEAHEIELMRTVTWHELALPARASRVNLWIPTTLMAACLAFVVVRLPAEQSQFTVKGSSKVFVVFEREGKARIVTANDILQAGDRVNVEIVAGENLKAFMGVTNRKGGLLTSVSDIQDNTLQIDEGKKAFFKTGIELTAENDGEEILIVTCNSSALAKESVDTKDLLEKIVKSLPKTSVRSDICETHQYKLRN